MRFLGMQSPPCPGMGQLCPSQVEMGAGYGQWGWGSLPLPAPAPCPPGAPKSSRQPRSRVSQGGCAAPALCPALGEPFSWLPPPSPPHWTVVRIPGSGQRPQPSPRVCSPCVREQQGCSPQHWRLGGATGPPLMASSWAGAPETYGFPWHGTWESEWGLPGRGGPSKPSLALTASTSPPPGVCGLGVPGPLPTLTPSLQ